MTKILAFAGQKQSGKSSAVNFIVGMELSSLGLISSFRLDPDGRLIVPVQSETGEIVEGEWNMSQQELTYEGLMFLDQNVYPFIKSYNFADALKRITVDLFGVPEELVNGTDEDKNKLTDIKWEDLPHYAEIKENAKKHKKDCPTGYLTARQFLQELGTQICRRIKNNCWVDQTLIRIKRDEPELALIGDCRFINEAEAVLNAGGKVIYLGKSVDSKDLHQSETDLRNFDGFSAVIGNAEMTMEQKNNEIYKLLKSWDYLKFEIITTETAVGSEYETSTVRQ